GADTGRFRLKVGAAPWITVDVVDADFTNLSDLEDHINDNLLPPHTATRVTVAVPAAGPLRITSDAPGDDVLIERAPQLDIAQELGLGVAQGGVEVGSYAAARPVPSGLVSVLDAVAPGDLGALLAFGGVAKNALDTPGVDGVRPFTVPRADIGYPSTVGNMNEGTTPGTSLHNVRENLEAIAIALSAGSDDWRAELHGYRLALIPTFGDSSSGAGASFTSATPDLGGANPIFDGGTGPPGPAPPRRRRHARSAAESTAAPRSPPTTTRPTGASRRRSTSLTC